MLKNMLFERNGTVYVGAAAGDMQKDVERRAARISLERNRDVHYEVINSKPPLYFLMTQRRAREVMTPENWIQELADYLSDPVTAFLARRAIPKDVRRRVIEMLNTENRETYSRYLQEKRRIARIKKVFSL